MSAALQTPATTLHWYVLTGAPCSGKSSVLEVMKERGYRVVEEAARTYIDQELSQGKTLAEVRRDEKAFQDAVLEMKFQIERNLAREQQQQQQQPQTVFFERGIPDSVAYAVANGFELHHKELEATFRTCKYKKVFLLERLPYQLDYARVEDVHMQERLHEELKRVYAQIPHVPLVSVPVLSVEERVDFICKHVETDTTKLTADNQTNDLQNS